MILDCIFVSKMITRVSDLSRHLSHSNSCLQTQFYQSITQYNNIIYSIIYQCTCISHKATDHIDCDLISVGYLISINSTVDSYIRDINQRWLLSGFVIIIFHSYGVIWWRTLISHLHRSYSHISRYISLRGQCPWSIVILLVSDNSNVQWIHVSGL